jgi:hypothetical protein
VSVKTDGEEEQGEQMALGEDEGWADESVDCCVWSSRNAYAVGQAWE